MKALQYAAESVTRTLIDPAVNEHDQHTGWRSFCPHGCRDRIAVYRQLVAALRRRADRCARERARLAIERGRIVATFAGKSGQDAAVGSAI